MRLDKIRVRPPEGWRREPTRRWFSQPYPWPEAVGWLTKNLFGPARDHVERTAPIGPEVRAGAITPNLTVGASASARQATPRRPVSVGPMRTHCNANVAGFPVSPALRRQH
jgi:hypothetical protein